MVRDRRWGERVPQVNGRLLVVLDEQIRPANRVVRRGKFLRVDGQQFLHPVPLVRRVGAFEKVLLGDGNHAARSARRIVNREMSGGDGKAQQLDHQNDDLAGGEVLPGLVAALFREAPEQFLVDIAHFQPG